MPRRPDSEAIARGACITAGCDQTILVFRTRRRGHHLMGRCPECQTIQGTGKAVQTALQAIVDGPEPTPEPSNAVAVTAPEPSAAPVSDDYDPGETVPTTTQPAATDRPGRGGLFVLTLAIVGGIFAFSLGAH